MFRENNLKSALTGGFEWLINSSWPSFAVLFLLSLVIRLNALQDIPDRYLVPTTSWELSSIAISLVKNGQFADPYMIPTGPTAHLPPIYPYIFSIIYKWWGLTATAGYVSMLFIIVSGSLLYGLLPWFSHSLGTGRPAGFLGGLAGALLVEWPGHGEYPTAIILALMLIAFQRRWQTKDSSWIGSGFLGLTIGLSFLLQPALLPVILGCMVFELWWKKSPRKWVSIGVMTLGIVLAIGPWTWRNYTTFNTLIFIRSNLGLELRMGNHEGAAATMEVMDAQGEHRHPRTHLNEARLLQDVGEIAYMRQAGEEALAWIKTNPGEFFWLTLQRFANLWAGPLHRPSAAIGVLTLTLLAVWGAWRTFPSLSIPQRASFLIPLITYPMIYYIVAYMPRYRVPIDWILYILAGAAAWSWLRRWL